MKRKYLLLAVAVLLLAGLNWWQWKSPTGGRPEQASVPAGGFRAEDFQLKIASTPAHSGAVGRDLFHPRSLPPPKVKKPEPLPGPTPKSPEQLAEEAARAELAQIRLVGVVFRGEKGQAFLVKGDQLFMVQAGEKIGERFQVESIRADSVQLKDSATQVSGQIPISGK